MPGTAPGAQNGSVNTQNHSSKNFPSRAEDRQKQGSQHSQFYIVTNSRKKMKWSGIIRSGRMRTAKEGLRGGGVTFE